MSATGQPVNDNSMRNDFLSARAAAGRPDDGWMRALVEGAPAGGAQTVRPSATTPAAAPSTGDDGTANDAGQPFGARLSNVLKAAPARAAKTFTGDVKGSWDQLKSDFLDNFTVLTPQQRQAFEKGSVWDGIKAGFDRELSTGKMAVDAFKLAMSPLSAALDTGADYEGQAVHALIPGVKADDVRKGVNQALTLLGPEAGGEAGLAEGAGAEGVGAKPAAAAGAKPASPNPALSGEGLGEGAQTQKPARAFDLAGEEPGSDLKITPDVRAKAKAFLSGFGADNPVNIHLNMLADPATRGEAVNQVAKVIPKDGVKPIDVTMMGAYSLNLQPEEVMAAIRPQFPSDETMAAAAMVINSGGKAVWDLANKAAESGAPEDTEAAVRAYAQFNDFIGAFRGAKTDWGRAGRIQQEVQGAFDPYTKHIMEVAQNIGTSNMEEVIRKVASLDDPAKVPGWVSTLRWMGGREGMLYGWYNYLLSNPATVVKKLASDFSIGLWNVGTRLAAEKLGSGAVAQGESMHLLSGYVGSMSDALRAAGKAIKAGQSQFYGDYQSLFDGKVLSRNNLLGDAAPEAVSSPYRAALEYLKSAMPTAWIGAADDFAKVANYRAELHAQAWRQASSEIAMREEAAAKGAKQGNLPPMGVQERYRYLLDNVPSDMHDQAVAAALKNTLSDPLEGLAKSFQETVDQVNVGPVPLGRLIIPFTKIATNVMRMAYRNSPIGAVPFLRSQALRADLLAGGARRDIALAQMGMGTAAALIFGTMVMKGLITGRGPSSPGLQRERENAHIPPYSMQIGGKWYGYNRVEPVATTIGAIADTMELMHYASDEDGEQLATSLVLGTGNAMTSKTYLSGMSNFLEALNEPDRNGKRWTENLLDSFAVPQGVSGIENAGDPWVRAHYGLMDSIEARTPGFAEKLPPARDVWGDPLPRSQGAAPFASGSFLANMLSPVREAPGQDSANPIDKWIWTNRSAFPDSDQGRAGISAPGQIFSQGGTRLKLTPQQLDRLKALAGNEAKEPASGLGAKDALNALVSGSHPNQGLQATWNRASPERRALMVGSIWNEYRDRAKAQLLKEDGNLRDTLDAAQRTRNSKLTAPNFGAGP